DLNTLINPDARFVLVPVVVEGMVDHIVAVLYDREENRVELYDSKGLTSEDRLNEHVRCAKDNITLKKVLNDVAEKYADKERPIKFWENTTKQQHDVHNCAIHVLDYYERRINGSTPDAIAQREWTFTKVNNYLREHFLQVIISEKKVGPAGL